ncbi:MAG: type ISP restriction/modification enzyme [Gammaproteobacteria bacterium]
MKTKIQNDIRAVREYAKKAAELRASGRAREHAYRACLQDLLCAVIPGAQAINEGERNDSCSPDFRVQWKSGALVGHVETKDIGANLDREEKSEQLQRYRRGFSNLVLTDYLEFRRYDNGRAQKPARLADEIRGGKMHPPVSTARAEELAEFLRVFAAAGAGANESPSPEILAAELAQKAKEIKRRAEAAMEKDDRDLIQLYEAFCKNLMQGLTPAAFADIFAQTAVYALFTARLQADQENRAHEFSRAVAGELLPHTTPFLRKFFNQFMQQDLDEDLAIAADNTAAYLRGVSMENIAAAFALRADADPFMHFYETFLDRYDGKLRRKQGVYYTPPPVVDFIVRAADYCLREFFEDAPRGLADSGKTKNPHDANAELHTVQILDPAAGTGAFLAKILETIKTEINPRGGWENYALEELLPRLYGFENMMSAYSVCHIKFALALGNDIMEKLRRSKKRVNVFLTDALDYGEHGQMGIGWLDEEAQAADEVKNKTPVMVVLGNPPYNVKSQNRGAHIIELLADYKKGLRERKLNLDDDYIKFIRNAEWLVAEKTGRGVVAFITNNSFYGGITHRQMREHLLRAFDKIYILNLHGKIGETEPGGGKDENVFSIGVGVGITVMVKTGDSDSDAEVFYVDCYGKQQAKFDFLLGADLGNMKLQTLSPHAPYYFFLPKDFSAQENYDEGVSITDLFPVYNSGIQTKCDELSVHFEQKSLETVVNDFLSLGVEQLKQKYSNKKDSSGWNFQSAKNDLAKRKFVYADICYRPFDNRRICYTGTSGGFLGRSRNKVMDHFIKRDNLALLVSRTIPEKEIFDRGFITSCIADLHAASDQTYCIPLYLYEEMHGKTEKRANIAPEFAEKIAAAAGMSYAENGGADCITPPQILDYVYAVLHNPYYRKKYAEFLKINFARIPKPQNKTHFAQTAKTGGELRRLHLLEEKSLDDNAVQFHGDSCVVEFVKPEQDNKTLKININAKSHFSGVPQAAWNLTIGGYRPAEKWLKDRKTRTLKYKDQRAYAHLITALAQTAAITEKMPPPWA